VVALAGARRRRAGLLTGRHPLLEDEAGAYAASTASRQPVEAPYARSVVAGMAVGCFLTWNVSNVGAVADPLADAYGTSLAVIGLLTTALFLSHLASQLPAGIWSDRFGPHRVGLAACLAAAAGNAVLLVDASIGVATAGRLVVGLGSGAGFVAGLDLVRSGGGGAVLQGLYGGATMAGGGLALLIVPPAVRGRARTRVRPVGRTRRGRARGCGPAAARRASGGDLRPRGDRRKLNRAAARA